MFATDNPCAMSYETARWIETIQVAERDRRKIAHGNAAALFRLDRRGKEGWRVWNRRCADPALFDDEPAATRCFSESDQDDCAASHQPFSNRLMNGADGGAKAETAGERVVDMQMPGVRQRL